MMTFKQFVAIPKSIPAATSWYLADLGEAKGKQELFARQAVDSFSGPFTLTELERKSPQISRDMVRKVLRDMQTKDLVECLGRGPGALWQRKGITLKRG